MLGISALSRHTPTAVVGAWRAFRSSAPQSHLQNAPLRPRRRAAPRSARSLAPSTTTRLHARVSQAASRPCVSLLVALSPLSSDSAFQGTRSHFRLAQNACAVAPSPRPVKPRPTRAPSALPRLPLVSRWSPVGRLPLLVLLTTWGFQQAPSGHCFTRRVSRPRCFSAFVPQAV